MSPAPPIQESQSGFFGGGNHQVGGKGSRVKLSKRSQKLVDDFSTAAQSHGWQSDQGVGSSVDNAESLFRSEKAALERHIARLEKKLTVPKTLKEKLQADATTPAIDEHAHWETAGGTTEEQNEARFAR